MRVYPTMWRPGREDLIGHARLVCESQVRKAERLAASPDTAMKLLVCGAPGIGKTTIVELIATTLTSHKCAVQDYNGREVTVDIVRDWMPALGTGNLWSKWSVKIVNELDRCSKEAQDLLLSYIDRMPPGRALLCTSNLEVGGLHERFQTRFQTVVLQPPTVADVAALITRRWGVPEDMACKIATASAGCVRAALADLETWLDVRDAELAMITRPPKSFGERTKPAPPRKKSPPQNENDQNEPLK